MDTNHLSSADDRLAGNVTHRNELLLRSENLGSRNLDTQITTGNHDTCDEWLANVRAEGCERLEGYGLHLPSVSLRMSLKLMMPCRFSILAMI